MCMLGGSKKASQAINIEMMSSTLRAEEPPSLRAAYGGYVKLYKGSSSDGHHCQRLLTAQRLVGRCSSNNSILFEGRYARALAPIYYVYCPCTDCENFLRAIIVSLIGKCVASTIQGRNTVEEIV